MSKADKSVNLKKLLIIAHCPSENTQKMGNALLEGTQHSDISKVISCIKSPFDCNADDVLQSDALILFTTENFGYMSGALKDFFDRIYYPCLADEQRNHAKPYTLVIKAGLDGTGTKSSVGKIITGLKWREAQAVTLCKGDFHSSFIEQCHTLGLTMAMSLEHDLI